MKKYLNIFFSIILIATAVACKENNPTEEQKEKEENWNDIIWDVAPYSITMLVTDTEGNNLFESSTPGNWLDSPISALYDDKEYTYPKEETPQTKEYLAEITGLKVVNYNTLDGGAVTYLVFGEFNGDDTLSSEVQFSWPDGSSDVISFEHSCPYINNEPHPKTSFFLNGNPVSAVISLVKQPASAE